MANQNTERPDSQNIGRNTRLRFGWPLESREWELIRAQGVLEENWTRVLMNYQSTYGIPMLAGVYAMCANIPIHTQSQPFAGLRTVLYVGRANNLRRRFTEHNATPSPKVYAAKRTYGDSITFWFLPLPDIENDVIAQIEFELINVFGPIANERRGNNALGVNVDLEKERFVSDIYQERIRGRIRPS